MKVFNFWIVPTAIMAVIFYLFAIGTLLCAMVDFHFFLSTLRSIAESVSPERAITTIVLYLVLWGGSSLMWEWKSS